MVALGLFIVFIVVGGIASQGDAIASYATAGADKIQGWLKSLGLSDSGASSSTDEREGGGARARCRRSSTAS